MKSKLLHIIITTVILLSFSKINYGQAPNLGTAADFVLFTSAGAISNTGISQVTGHVGTNSGLSTAFGNVNGVMHDNDGASAQAGTDLLLAYNQLNATVPTFFPAPLLGNGQILNAGVYSIPSPATLNLELTLDGQGNPNAVFIFQIQGAFSTNAGSRIKLINGTKACNVFWKVEGLVDMATGTSMKGTVVANNAAINMNTGDTLEGRALSTAGAITVSGVLAYTPIGCGSPNLTGPAAANLGSAACYAIFTSVGALANTPISTAIGDVGSNGGGSVTGWSPADVTGTFHPIPDGSTAACATDVLSAYNYLNTLPFDIELLYPAQFGNNLVLTPHTYRMNGSATFTDTLYLNALGNANAVFVIQINGALQTSTYSRVNLINGAQSQNVFWKVEGAVDINNYSVFRGTIISNNGAINLVNTSVVIDGRALSTDGAITTAGAAVTIPPGCGSVISTSITAQASDQTVCEGSSVSFSVAATGTSLTYQWRKGTVNLINGGNISGATSATLTINPASTSDAATNYNVVVTGSAPPSITSTNVSLIVNTSPSITAEPSNQTACSGSSASFIVAATGTTLTYQWRKGIVNLINGGNISGATSRTLTINPVSITDVALDYNVVVSGACLPDDNSINVSLLIGGPSITTDPTDQTACAGSSVSFSVLAVGTGLTYQWRKGIVNLINGGNISGATSATLTLSPVSVADAALNYNVVVSGSCLPVANSLDASLVVNASPSITAEPSNATACSGASVSFSVAATGAGLTYQWRKGIVNLINGGNISGATSASLTINPISITDAASNYNVVVSGTCLPNDISNNASLILDSPNITTQPADQTVCSGASVSFSVAATGAGLTYQWRKGIVNLINGGNISGATSATLTLNPATVTDVASNYNVIITGACLPNDNSINASLSINATPSITAEPSDKTICSGSSASFSITATGTGLTYQWRKGIVNLINGGNISGATSATLILSPANGSDAATNYNVVVSGTCLPNDISNNASLVVNTTPVANAGSNSPICVGTPINLTAQTVIGGAYSWTGPGGYSSFAQNPVISSASATNAGTYSLSVTTNSCPSAVSTVAIVITNCTDLSVVKTVDNAYPTIGETVIFTIVVTNNGPTNATGVSVTDILQSGYTYVSSVITKTTYDGATGIWVIGAMNTGTTETLIITATVIENGNYVNTATVSGNEFDPNLFNNTSAIETFPKDFFIPEGFSPNGDGINDLFVIRGIGRYPNNTFDIFNRWGDKVFEEASYKSTWNGKATKGLRIGGDELPVGTYFYILDLGDGSPVYKGTIYLNR